MTLVPDIYAYLRSQASDRLVLDLLKTGNFGYVGDELRTAESLLSQHARLVQVQPAELTPTFLEQNGPVLITGWRRSTLMAGDFGDVVTKEEAERLYINSTGALNTPLDDLHAMLLVGRTEFNGTTMWLVQTGWVESAL